MKQVLATAVLLLSTLGLCDLPHIQAFDSYSIEHEETDLAGLYDPDVLARYNATRNVDTLFQTDKYETYYFYNLSDNMAYNAKGSCGFVSMAMLLSFWDSYWDTEIVEEKFEADAIVTTQYVDLLGISPGVIKEPDRIANVTDKRYYENVSTYCETYFQFKLMSLFRDNIRPLLSDDGSYSYGLGYTDYYQFFDYYLNEYLGLSSSDYVIYQSDNSHQVRDGIIDLVQRGIPVRASIRDSKGVAGNHSVIAYDYDRDTDTIYCNFGWGSNTTHVTIESQGYDTWGSYTAIDLNTDHIHSDNYVFANDANKTFCSCDAYLTDNVNVDNHYLDRIPSFSWAALPNERWYGSYDFKFVFTILSPNRVAIIDYYYVTDSRFTLTREEWKKILDYNSNFYYVYIGLESPSYPYWDDYAVTIKFNKPTDYADKIQLKAATWNFQERYYFADEGEGEREYREKVAYNKNLKFTSQRLRCGYIENSYVTLSPRREGAGRAYFRLTWDFPVYSYMFGASLWSANEYLTYGVDTAVVLTRDSHGNWNSTPDFDLLSPGMLSTTRTNIKRYVGKHSDGITGLEFYMESSAVGDRNKGRICLDDIVLNRDPSDLDFISTGYGSIG